MTAPAVHSDTSARWTAPAGDHDRWFDEPWGRYAFAVEAATVLRGRRSPRRHPAARRRHALNRPSPSARSDPAAAVAELARVTRPGGRILIGALNPRSPWGPANHRRLRSGVWCHARFINRAELRSLAEPHGASTLHAGLFAPGVVPALRVLGPALEALGTIAPSLGAFQVIAIDKLHRLR